VNGRLTDVAQNLALVRDRIATAARASGRSPDEITLVAVSKEVGVEAVGAALGAGQRDFGENRAQELAAKAEAFASPPGEPPVWHFIGRVQRNKVKTVSRWVALWHSVDRLEVGESIARHAPGARVLVQVNVSGEEQKGGCRPADASALVDTLAGLGLVVEGLMTVPAQIGDPRPAFAALRELAGGLGLRAQATGAPTLSMGMSGDYVEAIAEGATMVRVGNALFGPRPRTAEVRPGSDDLRR
jgi:hypothetical protein